MEELDRMFQERHYILVGITPVKVSGILEWGKWFEENNRNVSVTKRNGACVSTVFLGIDHSFTGDVPILFETMVFGGKLDQYCQRYKTWKEAAAGHSMVCSMVWECLTVKADHAR